MLVTVSVGVFSIMSGERVGSRGAPLQGKVADHCGRSLPGCPSPVTGVRERTW